MLWTLLDGLDVIPLDHERSQMARIVRLCTLADPKQGKPCNNIFSMIKLPGVRKLEPGLVQSPVQWQALSCVWKTTMCFIARFATLEEMPKTSAWRISPKVSP